MADYDEVTSLVIDAGAGETKAGFAGDDAPRSIFTTKIGSPKVPGVMVGLDNNDVYVGQEAVDKRGVLKMSCPLENGAIKQWDDMEKIWNHCMYKELKVSPQEHPLLLTDSVATSNKDREKITQIMFEVFNVPALYLAFSPVLSLYANGKTTGVVVDSGEGMTFATPVYEGYCIPHAV